MNLSQNYFFTAKSIWDLATWTSLSLMKSNEMVAERELHFQTSDMRSKTRISFYILYIRIYRQDFVYNIENLDVTQHFVHLRIKHVLIDSQSGTRPLDHPAVL